MARGGSGSTRPSQNRPARADCGRTEPRRRPAAAKSPRRAGTDPDEDFRKNSGRSECWSGHFGVVSGGEFPVRILAVEDEANVARALQEGLEAEHYEVVVSATGETASFG